MFPWSILNYELDTSRYLQIIKDYSIPIFTTLVFAAGLWSGFFSEIIGVLLALYVYISVDLLEFDTQIKTPWKIRLLSAYLVFFIVFTITNGVVFGIFSIPFLLILSSIFYFAYIGGASRVLVDEVKWQDHSKISGRYKRALEREKCRIPDVLSTYYVYWWGKKVTTADRYLKYKVIIPLCALMMVLYMFAAGSIGLLNSFFTATSQVNIAMGIVTSSVLVGLSFIETHTKNKRENVGIKAEKEIEPNKLDFDEDEFSFVYILRDEKWAPIYASITFCSSIFAFIILASIVISIEYIHSIFKVAFRPPVLLYGLIALVLGSWIIILVYFLYMLTVANRSVVARHKRSDIPKIITGGEKILLLSILILLIQTFLLIEFDIAIFSLLTPLFAGLILLKIFRNEKVPLTKLHEAMIWVSGLALFFGFLTLIAQSSVDDFLLIFVVLSIIWMFFRWGYRAMENFHEETLKSDYKKEVYFKMIFPLMAFSLFAMFYILFSALGGYSSLEGWEFYFFLIAMILLILLIYLSYVDFETRNFVNIYDSKNMRGIWVYKLLGWYGFFTFSQVQEKFGMIPQDDAS